MPENSGGLFAAGRGFIFDLDGVVLDSMPLHTDAWRLYLERHHIPSLNLVERMHGRRNDEIVSAFFGDGLTPAEVFEHGAAKEALFREMMTPHLEKHLVPGIREFLEKYTDVPTGLASNAEPANIAFVLDGAGLRRHFDVIVDGHQVAKPKPNPAVYLRAAALLSLDPCNCIIFEDSPAGITAAVAAGAQVVAVETHTGELPQVDLRIRDFNDRSLPSWLESRGLRR